MQNGIIRGGFDETLTKPIDRCMFRTAARATLRAVLWLVDFREGEAPAEQ